MIDYQNKVAIVTGGSRGIGAATAKLLAANGCKVVVNFHSDEKSAKMVTEEIEKAGGQAMAVKADISSRKDVQEMIDKCLDSFGQINYLINNAGIKGDSLFKNMSEEDFDRVMNVNLKGVFHCCQLALPHMKEGDSIINISSVIGQTGNIGQVNYAASKSALFGLTKSLAKEYGRSGIRINCIAPGLIETDMSSGIPKQILEKFLEKVPLKKAGQPEDIARGVLFLVQNPYITGEILNINGGLY